MRAPRTGAVSTGTLGYSSFFKDSIYHLEFTFPHSERELRLNFQSSLFEGKGPADLLELVIDSAAHLLVQTRKAKSLAAALSSSVPVTTRPSISILIFITLTFLAGCRAVYCGRLVRLSMCNRNGGFQHYYLTQYGNH